ncbi:unnamed protein product [Rotaria magnacalcarata]|uniref:Uncharacterized protein n=1 Tax=Rotaria magnacalcarata TaxID=392030 RepID=A0A816SSS2_9BILA|nr:unnamed protein product [Rotaria magnacalcarata]CAF2117032.1 unnamed protein product [Rotaria magnacalcarata]CAF4171217.1 unnamed protein product [Rotaria magnacalcarata]
MHYVEKFELFRKTVRTEAIAVKNKEILTLCDRVRNEILPGLSAPLEDQASTNKATIKFCDPEVLKHERKQEEKEGRKLEQQLAKEAKEQRKTSREKRILI